MEFLDSMSHSSPGDEVLNEFELALLSLDRIAAGEILLDTAARSNPLAAIESLVIPCLERIGAQFEDGQLSLSQVYMSGIICEEAVDKMMPPVDEAGEGPRIAIGVLEDHHALGKKVVSLTLKSAGYNVADFGMGLTVDELAEKTLQEEIVILIVSVLTLPAAMKIKELKNKIQSKAGKVKIIAGGAPFRFDKSLAAEAGADFTAVNAYETIKMVSRIINEANGQ